MAAAQDLLEHKINLQTRADGAMILTSGYALGPVAANTGEWLHTWAKDAPDRVFLAERIDDSWREVTYGQALTAVRSLAAGLLGMGLAPGDRVAILSGNSVDHGLLALATQYVGIVSAPVAEQYSLIPEARDRLAYIIDMLKPKLLFVDDPARYAAALDVEETRAIPVLASTLEGSPRAATLFADLMAFPVSGDVDIAHAGVGPDTLAKVLFTSGSTAHPKGVCTTQRMMCVNQAQLAASMPFLTWQVPKILDWLPWNHVFGGSHNFNIILANGGSLYIDGGKPTPDLVKTTLANLKDHTGTLAFNVPVGWGLLARALAADADLNRRFFDGLDLLFYAGAPLPQDLWVELQRLADQAGASPLMTSSWGMTETAPATLIVHQPIDRSGVIGVPVPGCEVKLIPDQENRYELRVRGPNIMQAYYNDPKKTAEAFDDEGYLITGDAVGFLDPDDPARGLLFAGRMSEDFKLMSGTWVQAAAIRDKALAALAGLIQDVVVVGSGRAEIGLLIFPAPAILANASTADSGALSDAALIADIAARLGKLDQGSTGSSTRIARAIIMADPPSLRDHEVTAKGNLNVAKILARRSAMIDRLYSDSDAAVIRL